MKTRVIFGFLVVLIFSVGCRKTDQPELPGNLQRAPIPQFTFDSSTDLTIPGQDPDSFTGKFILDQYFKTDHSYKSFDIVIRKSGDNAAVKVLQADVTQLPATFTVTGEQLKSLFDAPVQSTDFFDIGADVTLLNGQKIEAFPSDGNPNYDPNVNTLPGLGPFTLQYGVFCNYDPSVYDGDFVVVEDDWADYHPGDVVHITKIDNTHFSFEYLDADPKPIVVTVDPVTNITSVDKVEFGNYGPGTGNFFAEGITSPNNYVLPCQGVFSVVFDISSDELGDFGAIRVVMRKQ